MLKSIRLDTIHRKKKFLFCLYNFLTFNDYNGNFNSKDVLGKQMANYNTQHYQPPPGGPPAQQPAKKKTFKKGLGFVPNSMSTAKLDPIEELLHHAPPIAKGQCAISEKEWDHDSDGKPTIPLFDLVQISQASGEEKARLIKAFGEAMTEVGFIGIKTDNLQPLIENVYGEITKYFHQPFDKKLMDWQNDTEMQGFSYFGCEIAIKAPKPDIKESFFVPSNFHQWPAGMPSFGRVVSECHSVLTEYAKYLVSYLMEYLNQSSHDGEYSIERANNVLRLAYYPSIKPDHDSLALWAAPRLDRSVISITSPGTIPGLQYYSQEGRWEWVIVPEGYLIVNVGKLLQHKTAGLMKTRWHRVVNPGGHYTRLERFSTSLFVSWPEDFSLNPFKNCVDLATRDMSDKRRLLYLRKYQDIPVAKKFKPQSNPA